jgi:hypothetical protein
LRRACAIWEEFQAPYGARSVFQRLGAAPDLARVRSLSQKASAKAAAASRGQEARLRQAVASCTACRPRVRDLGLPLLSVQQISPEQIPEKER